MDDRFTLSPYGEWLLAQLEIARFWAGRARVGEDIDQPTASDASHQFPTAWEMTRGIQLWDWQRQCAQAWLEQGYRGIAKVVTGAGKTIFAQHLVERVQREVDPELRVAIVVPTIVLMGQWMDSILAASNLPRHALGCLGGGQRDTFQQGKRILVCVLNSASTLLAELVGSAGIGEHLLLVVDECHRATGCSMSRVFRTPRRYNLGLSATPESEGRDDVTGETHSAAASERLDTLITDELGPVFFELGVTEAVHLGILSTFEIRHYGLPLDEAERIAYEKISREIRELAKTLKAAARSDDGSPKCLFRFAQHHAARANSAMFSDASRYLAEVRRRKNLLYRARARTDAVVELVTRTLRESPDSKILIFHESISQVMSLYLTLLRAGYRVTVDHSKLPDSIRASSISLFRSGRAQILVSARTLIEGFDVPSADVGIIAASSSSPRQRIQTIGRVLRRPRNATGKRAVIHTLYMAGTVDEGIYGKVDWGKVTGAEQNLYFSWSPPPAGMPEDERSAQAFHPSAEDGPPRRAKLAESEVDWTHLRTGDDYPGKFEGVEYHCDQQGNVCDSAGRPVSNPQDVPALLKQVCADASRFKVTPLRKAILCWDRLSRTVKFVGFLSEPFRPAAARPARAGRGGQAMDPGQPLKFRIKRFRGQRRIQDYAGKLALLPNQATDPEKGRDAQQVMAAVAELEKRLGMTIHELMIEDNEAYCIVNGQRQLLCRLIKGFEFR